MFYEIFFILVGIYLEQNYHLPSITVTLLTIQSQFSKNENNEQNDQGENFLRNFYKFFSKTLKN